MVEHTLLWTPRAKQRPRAHVVSGKAIAFTPRETVQAERLLAEQWQTAPVEGPISVSLFLSDTRVQVTIDHVPDTTNPKLSKGDIDNYAKLVLDALNGRAWLDDRQIVKLYVAKL
jgi:Holliday junction resolvase RusA-like endonuclease